MLRRPDPRDNPSTVLAAVVVGVLAVFAPVPAPAPVAAPPVAVAPLPAAPPPAVSPPADQGAAAPPLPVQRVVHVAARPVALTAGPVTRGAPTVVLTFDDGPDPAWTPQVVALLRQHGAVATFCMVAAQARKHPELVRDVVAAGMRLCDHTGTHPADLTVLPEPDLRHQVVDAQAELHALSDAPVAYFRAPGGRWSPPVLALAAEQGMQPLGWSIDTRDWEQPGRLPILALLERQLRPGAVILMHDGGGNRAQTVQALRLLLPWLRESGYGFTFPTP